MPTSSWNTATAVLRLASEIVDGVQQGLAERGFDDVRPVHGFAFARLSGSPATTAQLAEHLGITKQATSELVQHLVDRGYLTRTVDPHDRRARLLVLTEHGQACTRTAERAASATVNSWKNRVGPDVFDDVQTALEGLATPGRLRPAW